MKEEKLLKLTMITLEEEQSRIARDLHDVIGHNLLTTKLLLLSIFRKIEHTENSFSSKISECYKMIETTASQLSEICFDLEPISVVNGDLICSLSELFNKLNNLNILKFNFCYASKIPLNNQQKISIFRIVQEFSNNSLKHSIAENLFLKISVIALKVKIELYDDGIGFDIVNTANSRGLNNIINRILINNWTYTWVSNKNEGNKLTIHFCIDSGN